MSRVKRIENYYMRVGDFAYDPVRIDGTLYIRVAYVYEKGYTSMHLANDLTLVNTTMPPEFINAYSNTLLRNAELIIDGITHT